MNPEERVAQTRTLLPNLELLETKLKEQPETLFSLPREEGALGPRGEGTKPESPFESASGPTEFEELVETHAEREREWILGAATSAVAKLRTEGVNADFRPAEATALEALVLLTGRPAILVANGSFLAPPSGWEMLEQLRDGIETVLRSVGRIEARGHPNLEYVGTGFLVAEDVVMTNRHVVQEFSSWWRPELTFQPGMTPLVDYAEDIGGAPREFRFEQVIGIHQEFDLALLRVSRESDEGDSAPEPLTISSEAPDGGEGRRVYAVGYPAWDGKRNDPIEMQRIFSNIYGVKRLQPGELRQVIDEESLFHHDCSTLGGNSGSCIVDLETDKVLGLHFGGRYLEANQAVALWQLTADDMLRNAGVTFG